MEQSILYSLDGGFTQSAVFLSERLFCQDRSRDRSRWLYGACLLAAGRAREAAEATKDKATTSLGCAWIYARAALKEGDFVDGAHALLAVKREWQAENTLFQHDDTTRRLLPDAAQVYCLLGHLYRANKDVQYAIEAYTKACEECPFLWEAFEALLALGVDVQSKNVFKLTDGLQKSFKQVQTDVSAAQSLQQPAVPSMVMQDTGATPNIFDHRMGAPQNGPAPTYSFRPTAPMAAFDSSALGPDTPTLGAQDLARSSSLDAARTVEAPQKARPKSRLGDFAPPKFGLGRSASTISKADSSSSTNTAGAAATSTTTARRSTRLLPSLRSNRGQANGDRRETKKARLPDAVPAQVNAATAAAARATAATTSQPTLRAMTDTTLLVEAANVLTLLCQIAEGCNALSRYQCRKAVMTFDNLPEQQRRSPFVVAHKARALFETGDYAGAHRLCTELKVLAPASVQHLDLHSTSLWHLGKDVELSYLAHEAMELDRSAPQAWCVLANCFSLQREHEQALRCVRRAIDLDDAYAYAHSLEGHEYASVEEFERAQASFRRALRCDARHYTAWYGLGMTYMKTGMNDQAQFHFAKAAQVNPTNAVLVTCRGIVLDRQRRHEEALEQYERACELAPTNALARFKKAKALMQVRDYTSAMNDLHILKELAPDEANVHYLLGKLYRQFGDKQNAMKHLTIAMNLDNKASHLVKETIENMDELDTNLS